MGEVSSAALAPIHSPRISEQGRPALPTTAMSTTTLILTLLAAGVTLTRPPSPFTIGLTISLIAIAILLLAIFTTPPRNPRP